MRTKVFRTFQEYLKAFYPKTSAESEKERLDELWEKDPKAATVELIQEYLDRMSRILGEALVKAADIAEHEDQPPQN